MSELASFRAAIEDLWWYCRLFRHDRTRDDRRRAERVSRALDERGYELFSFCRRRMLGARPVPDRLVRNTFAAFYASWLKSHVGRPKQHARSYIVMPRWRL
ncbi:MAG TPA: hypothetical protein VKP30_12600, partial [Polyangiaceae bacterium]|nr:hypothetical protein [Polyangiaceae bacterium]